MARKPRICIIGGGTFGLMHLRTFRQLANEGRCEFLAKEAKAGDDASPDLASNLNKALDELGSLIANNRSTKPKEE